MVSSSVTPLSQDFLSQEVKIDVDTLNNILPQILVPVDTEAVLREIEFQKYNYDSVFTIIEPSAEPVMLSTKHIRKRDLMLPLVLLCLLIYVTWLRYVFGKELSENITVIINTNLGQQIYRDREFSANIFKFLTFINFAAAWGVFCYLFMRFYNIQLPFELVIYNIGAMISLILLLYFLKGIVYYLLAVTFKLHAQISFFRFNSQVIYHLLGIGLLPFIILGAFAEAPIGDWAIIGGCILILIAFFLRMIKGFVVAGMFGKFHIVYFLLYICALEIAPLLIAVKVFSLWA